MLVSVLSVVLCQSDPGFALAAETSNTQSAPAGQTNQASAAVSDASARTQATPWEVSTLTIPGNDNSDKVTLKIAVHAPPAGSKVNSVLLFTSTYLRPELTDTDTHILATSVVPWMRDATLFNQQGIAIVFVDTSSDANGRLALQRLPEFQRDLKQTVRFVQDKFPRLPIDIGIYTAGTRASLTALKDLRGLRKAIVVSGMYGDVLQSDWSDLPLQVLSIHVPSAYCVDSPFFDAQAAASKNHFILVTAGYRSLETSNRCSGRSQSSLQSLDRDFVDLVVKWLNNAPIPDHIGADNAPVAWQEETLMIPVGSGLLGYKLQTTIIKPPGNGPFPILVMNHGKAPGNPHFQERYRALVISHQFVDHGYAVVLPMRKGFAASTGMYVGGDCSIAGNGEAQAEDVRSVLDYVVQQSWADKDRIVIAGQSHGGLTTMAFGEENYPGVKGLINFAGGLRIDDCQWRGALVDAFRKYGAQTKVPSLWFYGANDSYFNPEVVRNMYAAYTGAGGHAKLIAYGPFKSDAHGMSGSIDGLPIWLKETEQFLQSIGMPSTLLVPPAIQPMANVHGPSGDAGK